MRKIFVGVLLAGSLAAANLDPNTVTVTATRPLSIQPDQALIYISLMASQDAGLDDVLAKLKPAGVTAANLSGVGGPISNPFPVDASFAQWYFLLPLPFTTMKDTVTVLTQLQTSLGSVQGSQALTFSVVGTQISDDARAAQPCPLAALVSDARKQADAMAAAAGIRTGAILSMSDGSSTDGNTPVAIAGVIRNGDFSAWFATGLSSTIVTSPQPSCSLMVQFQLVQ
jgi:uncharacterized protein YggE